MLCDHIFNKALLLTTGLTWQKYIPASLKGMMKEDANEKNEGCKVKDCIL